MPTLPNPRHEKFAQLLATGLTQDDAYEQAGYKRSRHHASRLATKGHVRQRVAELQGKAEEITVAAMAEAPSRAVITIEKLTDMLLDTYRDNAGKDGNQSARVSAIAQLSKMHGLDAAPRGNDRPPVMDELLAAIDGKTRAVPTRPGGETEH